MPELHQDAHDIAYSLSRSKSIEADISNCIAINPNIMQINCSSQMNILHYLAISSCVPESNFTIILKRLFAYDYHGFINALSTMNYELSTPLHLFLSWKHTSEERLDVLHLLKGHRRAGDTLATDGAWFQRVDQIAEHPPVL